MSRFPFFLFLFLSTAYSFAQTHEVGLGGGVAHYRGDMSSIINVAQPSAHAIAFYRYNPTETWAVRLNVGVGQIKCADSKSNDNLAKMRGHEFLTNLLEFSGQIEYNFLNFGQGTARDMHRFSPYALAGLGLVKLESVRNTTSTASFNSWARAIPLGLGIKWLVKRNLQISTEFGARFTNTDNLDALQNTNSKLSGNPKTKDMYFFSHISLSYIFRNKKDLCPQF